MVPGMSGGREPWCREESLWGMRDKGREGSARAKGAEQKQHHNKDTNVSLSYISASIHNPQSQPLSSLWLRTNKQVGSLMLRYNYFMLVC